jgi:hypothetical protein
MRKKKRKAEVSGKREADKSARVNQELADERAKNDALKAQLTQLTKLQHAAPRAA